MNIHVFTAVFRRNFVSYFASPTGYVFICLFVLLGSVAAFWPPEFFGNNLANLDQFSYWFPFIMLIYIPTVTMGIWADERKQGTDELLLTIPAGDFDIVLGKYLAAVAIFVVSLLFSMLCNLAVLMWLGDPDVGLLTATYIGYLLVGVAMLAVGMVASFLTGNVTIGFVAGVLLNVPLAFLGWTDAVFGVFNRRGAMAVESWSLQRQFDDFGHGVLSLAGLAYFLMIVVVMLYASMALIGRRHWFSGRRRWPAACHYALRTLLLAAAAAGIVATLRHHDVRYDLTSEKLSSLARQTRKLLGEFQPAHPVQIEAFISPDVPEKYVQTQKNLRDVLRELQALGGTKVRVQVHDVERFSQEADLAKKTYGIEPREVTTLSHGMLSTDQIFLHVAAKCGLQSLPPIFIDQDTPVEYDLVHAICTLSQQKRKKIGVLATDAPLFGGFSMQGMTPNWQIVDELETQYDVTRVDPSKPIVEKVDALLAVQPSTLGPQEMENFIAAVRGGMPTAIFEDPAPVWCAGLTATSAPYRQSGGNMFMPSQPLPKGDLRELWNLLGVDFAAHQIIWQDYNPYKKIEILANNPEFVFIGKDSGAPEPFGPSDPISVGLQQVLLPFPGAMAKLNSSDVTCTPLMETGDRTGFVAYSDLFQPGRSGLTINRDRQHVRTSTSYVTAAHLHGGRAAPKLNVVLVSDVDMISQIFFQFREQGEIQELGIHFSVDNVTFVLNALDSLAGDDRFIDLRKRRPRYRTLSHIEEWTAAYKKEAADALDEFTQKLNAKKQETTEALEKEIAALQKREDLDENQKLTNVLMLSQNLAYQQQVQTEQLRQERNRERDRIETKLAIQIRTVQARAKLMAVLLPPILPLAVAIVVFFNRRVREREGVARSRLR